MLSTLLGTQSVKYLKEYIPPAAVSAGLPTSSLSSLFTALSTGDLSGVPGINLAIQIAAEKATQMAYSRTFRIVYLSMLPFGVCLIVAAVFSPNMEEYLTDEVPRRLQEGQVHENDKVATEA